MARGNSIAGIPKEKEKYLKLANEASEKIEDEEDKKFALSEIATIS